MAISDKIKTLITIVFIIIINNSCKNENHIDRYEVKLDSLKTLPDNFYAYRRGRIYLEDVKVENYRIWFNLDDNGNVKDIFEIEDFKNKNSKSDTVTKTYAIDTSLNKVYAQTFIELSRKYKFGHIYIDKENKISFSYKDGITEQYVRTLNDSMSHVYANKKDFKLLKNGWFENVEE
jgi:hypothetical protein